MAAVGLVEASSENISIGTSLSEVVTEVPIAVGQVVKCGQPLFKLDVRQLQADLAARQANLEVAQAEVKVDSALFDDAKQQLDFAETLSDKRAISSEELARRRFAKEARGGQGPGDSRSGSSQKRGNTNRTQHRADPD